MEVEDVRGAGEHAHGHQPSPRGQHEAARQHADALIDVIVVVLEYRRDVDRRIDSTL